MRTCRRFESEGLLRLEQGLPLDEHFETCPDCRAARAQYAHLMVLAAGDEPEPPPHWKERVWKRIEERRASRRRRFLLPAGAAAAAALVLFVLMDGGQRGAELALQASVEASGGEIRRGSEDEAQPGDRLHLQAVVGDARGAELRVYRDGTQLASRCSDQPPCERRGTLLTATFVFEALGAYRPVLLVSDRPIPPPSAGFDEDVEHALEAGAQVRPGPEITVR